MSEWVDVLAFEIAIWPVLLRMSRDFRVVTITRALQENICARHGIFCGELADFFQ